MDDFDKQTSKRYIPLLILVTSLFGVSCAQPSDSGIQNTNSVVTDSAHIINPDDDGIDVEINSDGRLVFNQLNIIGPNGAGYEIGDVVVASTSTSHPNGLLKKITSVVDDGGQLEYIVEDAVLTDVLESASVSASGSMTTSAITSEKSLKGAALKSHILYRKNGESLLPANAISGANQDELFNVSLDDVVIYDADGNENTVGDQILLNGGISFTLDFEFNLDIASRQIQRLEFIVSPSEESEISLSSNVSIVDQSYEKTIASYKFRPLVIMAGFVPIVITRELEIKVGISGQVSVGITTGITQDASLTGGLVYDGTSWDTVLSSEVNLDFTPPTLDARAEVRAFIGPELSFKLYGIAGPTASVEGYLLLDANINQDPWWTLYGGITMGIAITADLFDHNLVDYQVPDLFAYELVLAQAEADPQPPSIPTMPQNLTITPADGQLQLSWDSVAGASSYNLYWSTAAGANTTTSRIANASSPFVHTGRSNGTAYYYVVTAVNISGESVLSSEASGVSEAVVITLPVAEVNLSQGLVAYYPFDGNATDASGNGNNGVEYGGVVYVPGVSGQAASFDGVDDYIDIDDNLLTNGGDWSFSGWFNGSNYLLSNNDGGAGRFSIAINNTQSQVFLAEVSGTSDLNMNIYSNSVVSNSWHYLSFVFESGIWKIYVDGVLETQEAVDFFPDNTKPLHIGVDGVLTSTRFYSGAMDDVRVYSRALSETEIQQLAGVTLDAGLVAHYKFDGDARDASGNGNNGTENGGVAYVAGVSGQAASLDGVDDSVILSDTYDNSTNLSVSLWTQVDTSVAANYTVLYSNSDSISNTNFAIKYSKDTQQFYLTRGYCGVTPIELENLLKSGTVLNAKWYHLVGTIDHSINQISFYLDGILLAQSTFSEKNPICTFNSGQGVGHQIGHRGDYFLGSIDDVRIYNRVIYASEVAILEAR